MEGLAGPALRLVQRDIIAFTATHITLNAYRLRFQPVTWLHMVNTVSVVKTFGKRSLADS